MASYRSPQYADTNSNTKDRIQLYAKVRPDISISYLGAYEAFTIFSLSPDPFSWCVF